MSLGLAANFLIMSSLVSGLRAISRGIVTDRSIFANRHVVDLLVRRLTVLYNICYTVTSPLT